LLTYAASLDTQVYERIKAPLLTLIASACPEIAYAVVAHLRLLVQRVPVLFATNHKSFYCRFSDPPYIKKLKLEMLTAVADSNNVYEVRRPIAPHANVAPADKALNPSIPIPVSTSADRRARC
jgi:vesicle coat complex subunit